jgi:2-dehydro-3-deoxyphosphogluconate aldolase/(4S)-4-hydroxy-2-oxoglutarate aldolase
LNIHEAVAETKIVAIMRGVSSEYAEKTVEALLEGGIKALEITLTTDDALEAIELVCKKYGDEAVIGAGTVLTAEEVSRVRDAGGQFIVSPNTNADVIRHAKNLGLATFPGALTPTEAVAAVQAGADYVKLFPAGNMGLSYFKALRAPLPKIPFIVTGGIDASNLDDYIKAGAAGAGIGGNLVSVAKIKEGNFRFISETAVYYLEIVRGYHLKREIL